MGVCGCVAAASTRIEAAWREASPGPDTAPGFRLQAPRPDSELARAGVESGERLLAVDARPIRAFTDAQAAIREHQIGEEVHLRIQRGSEASLEVRVRHVGDYPVGRGEAPGCDSLL